jgi:hypothetical protein
LSVCSTARIAQHLNHAPLFKSLAGDEKDNDKYYRQREQQGSHGSLPETSGWRANPAAAISWDGHSQRNQQGHNSNWNCDQQSYQ